MTYPTVALVAVFTNSWGRYVGDNRFELYQSPGQMLTRSFWLWDPARGLGRPRGEYLPVTTAAVSVLRGIGLPAFAVQRIWHAVLLVVAGIGVALLLKVFRPVLRTEHLLAGFLYMFNPFSAVFLVPSALFLYYALAPWFVLAFVRGVTGSRPYRWAGVMALLVFAGGTSDPPGLAYTMALLVPSAVYVLVVARTTTVRRVLAWLAGTGALSVVVSAATAVQVSYGSTALAARLFQTESASVVNSASSVAESWRGLGFWLSYFQTSGRLVRTNQGPYLTSTWIVVATFALPVLAIATICFSRARERVLFGAIMVLGVVLMVGSYPPGSATLLGRAIRTAYYVVPSLTALRNSYKAGSGLMVGMSVLVAVGVIDALRRLRPVGPRVAVAAGVALVVLTASFPFWTGQLYVPGNQMAAVPGYWTDAIRWLDSQPDDLRAFIAPGTANTVYRWGRPGDDLFDAEMSRAHIIRTGLPLSSTGAANLVDTVDTRILTGNFLPGALTPPMRALGAGYLVIRNDLDWQVMGRPRPAALAKVRHDPELQLVATFGSPGENVTSGDDTTPEAAAERQLPPVEVYRVSGVASISQLVPPSPPLLVAGDGDAWFPLGPTGLLDGRQVRYTGQTDEPTLTAALQGGSTLVVTDTNRRRVSQVTGFGWTESQTLADGQSLDRNADDTWKVAGSQSTAWYPDATTITASGRSIRAPLPAWAPSRAFDGRLDTSWLTGDGTDPTGSALRVDLKDAKEVGSVTVTPAAAQGVGRRIGQATLVLSDGSARSLDLSRGPVTVDFPPGTKTRWIALTVDSVVGRGGNSVGIAEVEVPGLDLREVIQAPTDVFADAAANPELGGALQTAPVLYSFERLVDRESRPVEPDLRRRFEVVGDRSYAVTGRVAAATGSGALEAGPACLDNVVSIDLQPYPVRLSAAPGSPGDFSFTGCAPAALSAGWHRVDNARGATVDEVKLQAGTIPGAAQFPGASAAGIDGETRTASRLTYDVRVPAGGSAAVVGALVQPRLARHRGRSAATRHPASRRPVLVRPTGGLVPGGGRLRAPGRLPLGAGVDGGGPARRVVAGGPASEGGPVKPLQRFGPAVLYVAAFAIGFGLAWLPGALVSCSAVLAVRRGGFRAVSVLLVAAAIAMGVLTLTESPLAGNAGFAFSRPVTTQVAGMTLAITAVVVMMLGVQERRPQRAELPPVTDGLGLSGLPRWFRDLGARRLDLVAVACGSILAADVVLASVVPTARASTWSLARSLQQGTGYAVGGVGSGRLVSGTGPLTPFLLAVSPVSGSLLRIGLGCASVVLAVVLARRWRWAGYAVLASAVVVGVAPLGLAGRTALVLLLGAVVLAGSSHGSVLTSIVAGLAAAAACLSIPELLLLVPALLAYLVAAGGPDADRAGHGREPGSGDERRAWHSPRWILGATLSAVVALAPWFLWSLDHGGRLYLPDLSGWVVWPLTVLSVLAAVPATVAGRRTRLRRMRRAEDRQAQERLLDALFDEAGG